MSTIDDATSHSAEQQEAAFFEQLAERSKTDPLIGAKMGSQEVTKRLMAALKSEQGVHIESLIGLLGALAGYACQASVRAQAVAQGLPDTALMTVLQASDGNTYYVGDALNKPLAQAQYSVWGIAGAGAQDAGCAALPDVAEIFSYAASVIGSDAFGQYRVAGNKPGELPRDYLKYVWAGVFKTVVRFCPNPEQWPVLLALALRDAIIWGKTVLNPCLALQLGMDSAVQMSMVQLDGQ